MTATKKTLTSDFYKPLINLAVGLLILIVINAILVNLPMVQRLKIPGVPFYATAIVSAVIGIIMIYLFIAFRRDFMPRLQNSFPESPLVWRIVSAAIILAIILVAYSMFDRIILPYMNGFSWVYHLGFLIIALFPLYTIIMALYRSAGKISELLTGKVAEATGEMTKCPTCNKTVKSDAKFCPECGANMTIIFKPPVTICSKCGKENDPGNKFCSNCGNSL